MRWKCKFCAFSSNGQGRILQHYKERHGHHRRCSGLVCVYEDCLNTFQTQAELVVVAIMFVISFCFYSYSSILLLFFPHSCPFLCFFVVYLLQLIAEFRRIVAKDLLSGWTRGVGAQSSTPVQSSCCIRQEVGPEQLSELSLKGGMYCVEKYFQRVLRLGF